MLRTCSLVLLAAALGLAACDANDHGEPLVAEPGRFSATVTFDDGDRLAFAGLATASAAQLFVIDSAFTGGDSTITLDSLRTAFTITLGEAGPAGPGRLISFYRMGDQPAPGTYPLGRLGCDGFDRDGFFGFFTAFDGATTPGGGTAFVAESGTLTLDVSTAERAAGRFEFHARSFAFGVGDGDGQRATVRGTFDADIRDLDGPFSPETPRP